MKQINIPLQDIQGIIDAGKYGLYIHNTSSEPEKDFNPWDLINSMTETLEKIFGDVISGYDYKDLPTLIATLPKFKKWDKVEISGNPIVREDTVMINYIGLTGVILDILPNGNYWVGIDSKIPCVELQESDLKPIQSI